MNDISEMLTDSAARLFTDVCTREAHDAAEAGAWLSSAWSSIDAIGLTSLDEICDDAATEFVIMAALARTAGAFAVPLPIVENLIAQRMLRSAGLETTGAPATIAVNLPHNRLTLRQEGGKFIASGALKRVPWGRHSAEIVATAVDEAGRERTVRLAKIKPVRQSSNLAGEARDDFAIQECRLEAGDVGTPRSGQLSPYLEGALMRSFQIAGSLERVLEMCVQYSTERVQFGRPIAKFQAIQHQIAELAGHVAAASVAADAALLAAQHRDAEFEIAAAKLTASEAATIGYAIAHQVHGAMGFTHEHALHLSTRRLLSWRDEFGSEVQWAMAVARRLKRVDHSALWQFITASSDAVSETAGN